MCIRTRPARAAMASLRAPLGRSTAKVKDERRHSPGVAGSRLAWRSARAFAELVRDFIFRLMPRRRGETPVRS